MSNKQIFFENKKHVVCMVNKYKTVLKKYDDKRQGVTTLTRGYLA